MKNLMIINFLVVFFALGCTNSNQNDDLFTYYPESSDLLTSQNNLDTPISIQEAIEIKLNLYASGNIPNLDLPFNFSHLILKKELAINGEIIDSDNTNSTTGSFKCLSIKIDSTNENIIMVFSGTLTLNNNELIFYQGYSIINIENKNHEGVFIINSGTGKYESSKGNINLKGTIDFNSGDMTMVASGTISMNYLP